MSVGLLSTMFPVDPLCPLNAHHRLNVGRTAWLLGQPAIAGGRQIFDITGRTHAKFVLGASSATKWVGNTRPGSIGPSISMVSGTGDRIDWSTSSLGTNFFSASTGTIAIWFRYSDSPLTQAANAYALPTIWGDFSRNGFVGLHIGIVTGIGDRVWAYNWDGAQTKVGGVYTQNVWCRAMWVHTGGTLILYINGVSAGSISSGNTATMPALFAIGDGGASDSFQFDDFATWNRGLSASEALEDYEESLVGYPNVLNRLGPVGMFDVVSTPGGLLRPLALDGLGGTYMRDPLEV